VTTSQQSVDFRLVPANFSDEVVSGLPSEVTTGIYYGWAKLDTESEIRKATISIGWNPYYRNVKKSVVRPPFFHTGTNDAVLRSFCCDMGVNAMITIFGDKNGVF
jgi:hypothetical protein